MKNTILTIFIGASFLYPMKLLAEKRKLDTAPKPASVKVDITNTAELNTNLVLDTISDNLDISRNNLSIHLGKGTPSLTSDKDLLYILLGASNTKSPETLSPYFRNPKSDIDMDTVLKNIKQVSTTQKLTVTSDNNDELKLQIVFNNEAWGISQKKSFTEAYLLTGKHLESTKNFGRWPPHRTDSFYQAYFKLIYCDQTGKLPFEKIEPNTWIYAFPKTSGQKLSFHSRVYFEAYAKSIDITYQRSGFRFNFSNLSKEDKKLIAKETLKAYKLSQSLAHMILAEAERKGIFPDTTLLEAIANKRLKNLGESTFPVFVEEIEKERNIEKLETTADKAPSANHSTLPLIIIAFALLILSALIFFLYRKKKSRNPSQSLENKH